MSAPDMNIGAVVSLSEIYQDIKAMRTDVTQLLIRTESNVGVSSDHESRIRSLEKRVWVAAGSVGVLASIIPQLGHIFSMFGG